jgi:hypothetical protein
MGHPQRIVVGLLSLLAHAGFHAPAAGAASIAAGAGYDYQSGPDGATWSGPLGFATTAFGQSDATLLLSRFHSSDVGWGWSGLGNAGIAFGSQGGGRVVASRSIGDGDYRAWQVQVGPTLRFGEERTVFLYGNHSEDNIGARLNQIGAEANVPVGSQFTGLAGAAFGARQGGETNAQGTLGVTWSRWKGLLLIGQTTFGKNIAASSSQAGGGATVVPVGSKGQGHSKSVTTGTANDFQATALVGIRVVVP